jgi:hypothetical protein
MVDGKDWSRHWKNKHGIKRKHLRFTREPEKSAEKPHWVKPALEEGEVEREKLCDIPDRDITN